MVNEISSVALLRAKKRAEHYGVTYQLVLGNVESLSLKHAAFNSCSFMRQCYKLTDRKINK